MFRNILLATDGSAASAHAAKLAVRLASAHHAKLTVVYVVDPYPYLGLGDTNPMGLHAYLSSARDHAAVAHSQVVQLCAAAEPPVPVELRLVEDVAAAKGILRTAQDEQCDLVVAGSHGRGGAAGLLLGSVANKLVTQSPVPVLVAR
ncbi:universal stress protein [Caenimonas aquaedulcis]|uniref:Universal stress protein n=1 Tax=Caenimonas aquaedulcis TaxID=2793270 RepID=A0A931H7U9_9BURK|nr:universal stress protein [Caenimonas aquaedulcis]MBG9390221.1 universal stress protein [Caenimonas aquaedulcis]